MASIEKRGKYSWRLVVEAGYDSNGKRKKRYKTIRVEDPALLRAPKRLQEHLELELAKFKIEVEAGEYFKPEKMTFAQFVENEWLPKYAVKELEYTTLDTFKRHLKNHILPVIGHKRLEDIKPIELVTLIDSLSKPGANKETGGPLAPGTIGFVLRAIKNVFKRAHEWQFIKNDPSANVKRPKVPKTKKETYSAEEMQTIINALYMEEVHWRLLIWGTILGGFRRGEIIAIEWNDVDFQRRVIRIDENIPITRAGQALIKTPKTETSIRLVAMPSWYMEELAKYYEHWQAEKERAGDKWQGGDREFIFHSGLGKPFYYTTPSKWWRKFCERHGIRYMPLHSLRHSSATLLFESGASMKAIGSRLGHSSEQVTSDIYVHVTDKVDHDMAEIFEKFDPRNNRENITLH